MTKRVAVIGAGASGLPAIKWCIQYGFDVTCFEKQNDIGGLWRYREDDCEGEGCVMRSTITNTSKEMTAYSDFPPSGHCANFMHNRQMLSYLRNYAKQFELTSKINFDTNVNSVERNADGKWIVKTERNAECQTQIFDAVILCVGRHVDPYMPNFTNQNVFEGSILHSHSYKDYKGYEDKNVAIIGVGNSGCDIAVELSRIAKQVFLVTRRGAWVLSRLSDYGYPYDLALTKRALSWLMAKLPLALVELIVAYKANSRFDHLVYGLQPPHGPLSAHPTVNDELPNRIAEGTIKIMPMIDRFTGPKCVKFVNNTELSDVDAVIVSTGYSFSFPILENGKLIPVEENQLNLYKHMYSPNLEKPETLAVLGIVAPLGSARVFCHMLNGDSNLPSGIEMLNDIKRKKLMIEKRFVASRRHTIEENYGEFMDELADLIGCKPSVMYQLARGQFQLAYDILFAPQVSYQYRIQGPHSWPGASKAIRGVKKRALEATMSTVQQNGKYSIGGKIWLYDKFWMIVLFTLLAVFLFIFWCSFT